ncbi:MAG: hypothetical protein ACYCO9_18395 [Streptosporangiaceae bacterium]
MPALLPVFIAGRHYSYAAATGLTFTAAALSSVIQPVLTAPTGRWNLGWLVPTGLTVAGAGMWLTPSLAVGYPLTWLGVSHVGCG